MSLFLLDDNTIAVQILVDKQRMDLLKELLCWHPKGQGWDWMVEFNNTMSFPDNVFLTVAAETGIITYRIGEYVVFAEGSVRCISYDPGTQHCQRITEKELRAHPLFCVSA